MLYITGEYMMTRYPKPVVTGWQRILSCLVPLWVTADSEGSDYIQRHYFKHTYVLWLGRLTEVGKRLVESKTYDELRKEGKATNWDV